MAEPFGVYLENPRTPKRGRGGRFVKGRRASKRRRSSSRRRKSRRSRRRNPAVLVNPRRRRRSSSRRRASSHRRRRSYGRHRRNPFKLGGGNLKHTVMAGVGLAGGEIAGDLISRVAIKFGAGKLFDVAKVPTSVRAPLLRIAVGLFAGRLLKMLKVPASITSSFGAVNVASGLLSLTSNMRATTFARVGLGDYELADVLVGDDDENDDIELGDVLVGMGDYELADYELAGDYSDQDYYLNYEA